MNRWIRQISAASVLIGVTIACGGTPQVSVGAAEPAAAASQAPVGAPMTAAPAPTKFVAPVRGTADLGYLKPVTKRDKTMVITVIKVKNMSTGSIVGLKIAEFWWDKAGNPVTGSEDRLRKPLLPNETATLTLQTPYNAKMDRNNYTFTHANGQIKTKLLPKLE